MNDVLAGLIGQLHATQTGIRMLIDSHPEDEELRCAMRVRFQEMRDRGLFAAAPEGAFEGWDAAVLRMLGKPPAPRPSRRTGSPSAP